eukprot:958934-Amphidinium_carterae.1
MSPAIFSVFHFSAASGGPKTRKRHPSTHCTNICVPRSPGTEATSSTLQQKQHLHSNTFPAQLPTTGSLARRSSRQLRIYPLSIVLRCRDVKRDAKNGQISMQTAWQQLVMRGVLEKEFKFVAVKPTDVQQETRALPVPERIFEARDVGEERCRT